MTPRDFAQMLVLAALWGGSFLFLRMATAQEPMAVCIQADAHAFIDLLEGREDPDTLFFERRLVMEGDTAFALLLKNTLDAVGPVTWQPWRAPRPPSPTA